MLRASVWFGDNEIEVVALEWHGCGRCWLEQLLEIEFLIHPSLWGARVGFDHQPSFHLQVEEV